MAYSFDWEKLPEDMRLGTAPDDELVLYRGFAPHQLNPDKGMESTAVAQENLSSVHDVIDAVAVGDTNRLMDYVVRHAHVAIRDEQRTGELLTPFVSATPEREIAEKYAGQRGERLATIVVRAEQVTIVPLLSYEALILGSADVANIVEIEDARDIPPPKKLDKLSTSKTGITFDLDFMSKLSSREL